jgi:endonuclease/exonuclease/phosphatase (EEP) superfamily protein YafD
MRRARSGLAAALLVAALALAMMPWLGGLWPPADLLAAGLPAAPLLALIAVLVAPWRGLAALWALAALMPAAAAILPAGEETALARPGPRLVVVTHNVASANVDPALTARRLLASGADVLLLQEVDGTFAPMLDRLRARYPYGSVCRPRCSLAILSRVPMDRVRWRFRDEGDRPVGPPLVQSRLHVPGVSPPVPIVSIHLSRHLSLRHRERQRRALAAIMHRFGGAGLIVGGDFNLVPWASAMRRLDAAMRPARRVSGIRFSFPARWGGVAMPMPLVPIDHVVAGPGWAVARADRLAATGSDHYPIRVELVWQGT